MSQEYTFSLPYDAFDLDLIGLSQSDIGGSDFTSKVSEFFASEFAKGSLNNKCPILFSVQDGFRSSIRHGNRCDGL